MTSNDFFTVDSLSDFLPRSIVHAKCYGELKKSEGIGKGGRRRGPVGA
jgi:hypothetical protein